MTLFVYVSVADADAENLQFSASAGAASDDAADPGEQAQPRDERASRSTAARTRRTDPELKPDAKSRFALAATDAINSRSHSHSHSHNHSR